MARTFARQFSGQGEAYDVNVLPIETPMLADGDDPATIQWGHVMAMFDVGDTSKDGPAAQWSKDGPAAQWMMYLLSDAALVDYAADQSVLPATKSGLASERITSDPHLSAWAEATVAPRRNTIASLDNGVEDATIIGEGVQAALLDQKDAATAAKDMQARIEEAL